MYPLQLLIVALETAKQRLRSVFVVPDGTRTNEFRTPPIDDGQRAIDLLTCGKNRRSSPSRRTDEISSCLPTLRKKAQLRQIPSDLRQAIEGRSE